MTRDDTAEFVRRISDAWDRHDVQALMREHAADCVVESPTAGGTVMGHEAVESVYRAWFKAFPDLKVTTEQVIIDGADVAHIVTVTGTDTGGFLGLPPSHKLFRIPISILYRLDARGQIVRERRITDFTGLLVQIGVLKAKPA